MTASAKIPATIVTGFLGAGKTTLIRHLLRERRRPPARADHQRVRRRRRRRRHPESLRRRSLPRGGHRRTRQRLHLLHRRRRFPAGDRGAAERADRPDHIIIETSGLALPKPLVKAFDWPEIRARLTVDGVIAVVDAAAVADGRFADDRRRRAPSAPPTPRSITTTRSRRSTRTSCSAPTSSCSTRPTCCRAGDAARVRGRDRGAVPRVVKVVPTQRRPHRPRHAARA